MAPAAIRFKKTAGFASKFSHAKAYSLVLAHSARRLGPGTRAVKLKPSRRLIGKAKRFKLRLVVVATDAAGNRRTTTKTISVR